ncbi:hypothetical protein E5288_WYG005756 [Bos mutus]|uniref:Translationally-controlled tumor protein n=1 Tax=Bos mutus TaxID=72004 RepID=A0A6B0R1E4_9CETA|nr:hypothetical protein [Bos mutus]
MEYAVSGSVVIKFLDTMQRFPLKLPPWSFARFTHIELSCMPWAELQCQVEQKGCFWRADDDILSHIHKTWEVVDGLCLEVEGNRVSRTEGNTGDSLLGGCASAEVPKGKGAESRVITGVDIVLNHHLQKTSFTKEAYKKYIKGDIKSIRGKLEEQRPERVALLDCRERGVTPYMIFFRDGLEMEYVDTVDSHCGSVTCRHNWLAAAFHPHSTRA